MSSLVNLFNTFIDNIMSFFNYISGIFDYIFSIFKTLWYGLTSLLSGIWSLILDVFNGSVFDLVGDGFIQLSLYIGVPGVVFISSLFLIVLLRIIIAFLFKMFRLNIDYNTLKSHSKKWFK